MTFTPRRLVRWDDAALRDLNLMMDELTRELGPGQGAVAAGQPGVQITDRFVSDFYPGVTISGSVSFPDRVAHGLGVKPAFVSVTPVDGNTGQVYLPREPDATYIYLAVTSGTRKVWIKAEV